MKDFPSSVDGPLGLWLKRVNAAVAQARQSHSRAELLDVLGVPDQIVTKSSNSMKQLQELMEGVAGGPTIIQYGDNSEYTEVLVFRDPYRPNVQYMFGMRGEQIVSMWRETNA